jgi:hypothetical protein
MHTRRTDVVKTRNDPSVASSCYISGREVVHFGMGARSEIFDLPIVQLLCSNTGCTNPIIPSTAMITPAPVLVSTFGLQEFHGSITPLYTIPRDEHRNIIVPPWRSYPIIFTSTSGPVPVQITRVRLSSLVQASVAKLSE